MKVLVCGGRDFNDQPFLYGVLDSFGFGPITTIIHGAARGADSMAGKWARDRKIPELVFPADWNLYGKQAGPIRNQQMLDQGQPDIVVAFPGGRGTAHMISIASKAGVIVYEPRSVAFLDLEGK